MSDVLFGSAPVEEGLWAPVIVQALPQTLENISPHSLKWHHTTSTNISTASSVNSSPKTKQQKPHNSFSSTFQSKKKKKCAGLCGFRSINNCLAVVAHTF